MQCFKVTYIIYFFSKYSPFFSVFSHRCSVTQQSSFHKVIVTASVSQPSVSSVSTWSRRHTHRYAKKV